MRRWRTWWIGWRRCSRASRRGPLPPRHHRCGAPWLYRRDAFLGSAAATMLVLLVVGGAVAYWASSRLRLLDTDFRRLGYVSLSALRAPSAAGAEPELHVRGQVWLLAKGLAFRDVTFTTIARGVDGAVDRSDRSALVRSDQAGGVETIDFAVPPDTSRLTACLVMPNPALNERSRVTQVFAVPAVANADAGLPVALSPLQEPIVSREDGTLCSATP